MGRRRGQLKRTAAVGRPRRFDGGLANGSRQPQTRRSGRIGELRGWVVGYCCGIRSERRCAKRSRASCWTCRSTSIGFTLVSTTRVNQRPRTSAIPRFATQSVGLSRPGEAGLTTAVIGDRRRSGPRSEPRSRVDPGASAAVPRTAGTHRARTDCNPDRSLSDYPHMRANLTLLQLRRPPIPAAVPTRKGGKMPPPMARYY